MEGFALGVQRTQLGDRERRGVLVLQQGLGVRGRHTLLLRLGGGKALLVRLERGLGVRGRRLGSGRLLLERGGLGSGLLAAALQLL